MSSRKKQFRYFDSYVPKVLKKSYPENGITANARQQVNSILCHVAKILSRESRHLAKVSGKRTVSDDHVLSAVQLHVSEDIFKLLKEDAKEKTNNPVSNKSGESRQSKAGLILPPSITEKFLRDFGLSKIMVTAKAPVVLCTVLEKLCSEVLNKAAKLTLEKKKIRLTIREIEIACKDSALQPILRQFNIRIMGGGFQNFIHPLLKVQKPRKKKVKSIRDQNVKAPHRFRPGTVALREIKKLQRVYNHMVLAKSPFERVIREIFNDSSDESKKISKDVFTILQYYLESYLVEILHQSNLAAIHAGRVKVLPDDIDFTLSLRKGTLPAKIELIEEDSKK